MKQLHRQEKEQFKKLFREERIDQFDDRFKVLEAFLQTEKHVTAADLTREMEAGGQRLARDFVEDTLEHLCRFGFAQKNRFDNGEFYYEHLHLGHHHDHMICTKCRRIIEFKDDELESLQLKICTAHGFHMLQHKMAFAPTVWTTASRRFRCPPRVRGSASSSKVSSEARVPVCGC
jgi:Fur family ferric uptake transcriptional regulator